MNEQQKKLKKLKVLLIVLGVIIMPAFFRLLDSGVLELIRNIDIALLLGLGFVSGAFVATLKEYLQLRSK